MATLYHPDGRAETVEPKNGRNFELDELQSLVGGYIEIAYTVDGQPMVINEEGKLDGLPLNPQASALHRNPADPIVGPALVCKDEEID